MLLVEEINGSLDKSTSPVSSGKFKKRKKDKKLSELFEDGDMRAAITFTEFRDGVDVGVFDDEQATKAYAHNTGFKGHKYIPQGKYIREFIPSEKKNFKDNINKKVKLKISEILDASESD